MADWTWGGGGDDDEEEGEDGGGAGVRLVKLEIMKRV